MIEQTNRSHARLLAKLALVFPDIPVVSQVIVGGQAVEHDTALPAIVVQGAVSRVTTVAVRPRRPITRQEQLALAATLLGLHAYLMDLRRADLFDAGTLALIVAALLLVLALDSEAE